MARLLRACFCSPTSRILPSCFSSSFRNEAAPLPLLQARGTPKTRFSYSPVSALSSYAGNINGFARPRYSFDEMCPRDVISRTAEISSLTKSNRGYQAWKVFKSMLAEGSRPNYVTVLCIVRAITAMGLDELSGGIHAFVIKLGLETEISVCTVLLGLYSSLQDVESVLQLFYQNKSKDLVLWSALVSALSKNGRFVEAFSAFREMLCTQLGI